MATEQTPKTLPRLIRFPEVMDRTSKSRAGIYEAMKRGEFPKPVKLGHPFGGIYRDGN